MERKAESLYSLKKMNFFLQFKQKSHSEAYSHDLQLQVTKRMIMVTIWALIIVLGNAITFAVYRYFAMTAIDITRISLMILFVVGFCYLRHNLQRTKKYINKINIVMDICLIFIQFIFYPLVGGAGLNPYGKLGAFTMGWLTCIGCFSIYYVVVSWWIKAIAPIIQIVYFLVFIVQAEFYWPAILIFAAESAIMYLCYVYIHEKYMRKDFIEKRKVYENYEAIMKIFDDIIQGIMIVDQEYKIIYSNRTVDLMFNLQRPQEVGSSIERLFSEIQVKTISPRMDAPGTERMMFASRENEETVIKTSHVSL